MFTTSRVEEIKDVDARITFRSIKYTGNFSIYERVNLLLQWFASHLKFLKSLEGQKIKQVFKLIEGASRISAVYRGMDTFTLKYREEFLKFIADSLMEDKRIFYCLGKDNSLGLAVIPTTLFSKPKRAYYSKIQKYIRVKISLSQKSGQVLKEISDNLRNILKQELGQESWNKILETKAGTKLLRSGSIKSWPLAGDTIYTAYTILLPIYPTRAHLYGLQKWEGEKAKYPKALLKDLVQLFQERFQEDFKDLTESDVRRSIQYRMDKGLLGQYLF